MFAPNRVKRVKIDSSFSSETSVSTEEDLRSTVSRLQFELDIEKKSSKQLRREKVFEVQQVREQEQNKSVVALKDQAAKLHREKQYELDVQKESLRCRHETDIAKVLKQNQLETKRLQKDLSKCQEDLKEELTKRGLSTSARGVFEVERSRLLQELKDMSVSRKQLEDALKAAGDVAKQKAAQLRHVEDACRSEVARLTKQSKAEIRKLLEELKSKDHTLSLMDRNQYADRGVNIKPSANVLEAITQSKLNNILVAVTQTKSTDVLQAGTQSKLSDVQDSENQAIISEEQEEIVTPQSPNLMQRIDELEHQLKLANDKNRSFLQKNIEVTLLNRKLEDTVRSTLEHNKSLKLSLTTSTEGISRLETELKTSQAECLVGREMKSRVETLYQDVTERDYTIAALRRTREEQDRRIDLLTHRKKKKVPTATLR